MCILLFQIVSYWYWPEIIKIIAFNLSPIDLKPFEIIKFTHLYLIEILKFIIRARFKDTPCDRWRGKCICSVNFPFPPFSVFQNQMSLSCFERIFRKSVLKGNLFFADHDRLFRLEFKYCAYTHKCSLTKWLQIRYLIELILKGIQSVSNYGFSSG